ncbi:ATP-binding protein [Photobacterium phosphoreum]|uniref:ATP-binding protein n=1 Tax=Photobacterium phosphoreum TaxID=659 RepID=UPI001E334829|nr:ATP-binding protein [Photobacterium phosphoreum]MCD9506560.1 AAA family ATPase [Photobacterium phosphoreum]
MAKIIFVSGIHGVGKSTLCYELSKKFGWPHFSCSDLIKQYSDYVETSKLVIGVDKNQEALLHGVSQIKDDIILLDGHFCLINRENKVIKLDMKIFKSLEPIVVLNVTCDEKIIVERLVRRDLLALPYEILVEIQKKECIQADIYCTKNNCKILKYNSPYSTRELIESLESMNL